MGFNSAFKELKLLKKNPGNRCLNNLNDPSRPQCVNIHAMPTLSLSLFVQEAHCTKHYFGYGSDKKPLPLLGTETQDPFFLGPQ